MIPQYSVAFPELLATPHTLAEEVELAATLAEVSSKEEVREASGRDIHRHGLLVCLLVHFPASHHVVLSATLGYIRLFLFL